MTCKACVRLPCLLFPIPALPVAHLAFPHADPSFTPADTQPECFSPTNPGPRSSQVHLWGTWGLLQFAQCYALFSVVR